MILVCSPPPALLNGNEEPSLEKHNLHKPFPAWDPFIDFTQSNTWWFYSSKGDPLGSKGLNICSAYTNLISWVLPSCGSLKIWQTVVSWGQNRVCTGQWKPGKSWNLLCQFPGLGSHVKVAEYSLHTLLLILLCAQKDCNKTNRPSFQPSFYLLNARTICAICFHNWMQCTCIDSFSLLLQRYVRKSSDEKNLAILRFFFVTERTQLNAAHE